MRASTKTLALLLSLSGFFVASNEFSAAAPPVPTSGNSCGVPNNPTPPPRKPKCSSSPSDMSGDDSGASPGTGPSVQIPSAPPSVEIENTSTVIGTNHGGALLDTKDLEIPGVTSGNALDFTRYYNSRHADGAGDVMGHGRTWTHSFLWRLSVSGNVPRINFPTGRRLDFTLSGPSTFLGQSSTLYLPPSGQGETLQNIGNFWHLVMPGGAYLTFESVANEDYTVSYHPRSSKDTRGNAVTYTTDSSARIIQATDAAGNNVSLTYSQITLNRKSAVAFHTITAAPQVGWNEVILPEGDSYRWIQALSSADWSFRVSEVEFYKSNGSGGYTKLSGTAYGTDPAKDNGGNTYDKAFDNKTSTQFIFCRGNGGTAGLDLGSTGAAAVTKIRYYISGSYADQLGNYIGMRFEGMNNAASNYQWGSDNRSVGCR